MEEISIVICGQAGQGIKTVESLLTGMGKRFGLHVFSTKEYMSRIRGGMNSTEVRLSSRRVRGFVDRIDILVPLDPGGIGHVRERLSEETLTIGEEECLQTGEGAAGTQLAVPLKEIARKIGDVSYSNTVAVGVLAAILGCDREEGEDFIRGAFSAKGDRVAAENGAAFGKGFEVGSEQFEGEERFRLKVDETVRDEILISGTEGVGLGAIAAGCNFLSFYPMSPATGVGLFIAQHADEFGILVEQAEDEIAAINMALGGWYAGARGLVTTSGGGFALMTEGLSLAGMIETPVVIHLAQRPGPATGLPTRTGQEDLLFVLFGGHGEFPRVIFTPGTIEEAVALARRAFDLADRYQVPVFILTDQYLVDSSYNLPPPELAGREAKNHFVKTGKTYRRYEITDDGISPRGIPGYGEGLVDVDSDEHDETGHITEDSGVRRRMVDKRLKKFSGLVREIVDPVFSGDEEFKTLILGWGSTYHTIREAIDEAGLKQTAHLHFPQVCPLWPGLASYLDRAGRVVVVENNATGQFGRLITMTTGRKIDGKILKYDGRPFSLEEMIGALT